MQHKLPTPQQVINIFQARQDAYATWTSRHPVTARTGGQDIGLNTNAIQEHMNGNSLIGIYSTNKDDTCTWAALDFDSHDSALNDALTVLNFLRDHHIDALLERSKSGKGYHIWIFLDTPTPAYKIRLMLIDMIRKSGINMDGKLKVDKAFDRMFPNQDSIGGGYGNMIALPFSGKHMLHGNSLFVDPNTQEAYEDQLTLLLNITRVSEYQIDEYIADNKLNKAASLAADHNKYSPSSNGDIADLQHCKFIQFADEHRSDLPEPLWYGLATNIATFGEAGHILFHALSERHIKYSEKEADDKFNHAIKAVEQGKSPYSCKKLEQTGFSCSLLRECKARFPADFPAAYAEMAMTLSEMQQYTHEIAANSNAGSKFRRFALGWQQLDDTHKTDIMNQVADCTGMDDKQRRDFEKKLKEVKPVSRIESKYLHKVQDYFQNAPGSEELVIPQGYYIKDNKLYTKRPTRGGKMEDVIVADQMLIITAIGHDHDRSEAATRTLAYYNASGEWEQTQVLRADSSDGRTLHKALGNTSFVMSSDQGPGITKYLKDFEIANSLLLRPRITASRLGWVLIDSKWEFIPFSKEAILAPKGAGDQALGRAETFAAYGTAAQWLKLFDLLQSAPVATFIIVAALTPPLFLALDVEAQSHTIVIAGKAGSGKSAIQKIAANIYGLDTALLRNWDATPVGLEQALALRTHTPAMYEDLQNASDYQINSVIYRIFNGLGRERGAKEGGTRKIAEFRTVMIASAEADIREKAQYAGFLRRSLVVTDPVFGSLPHSDISQFVAGIDQIAKENRGSVGCDWIQHIKTELLEEHVINQTADRVRYWIKTLQQIAPNGTDATLARLMAQHMISAELLERWYNLGNIVERLKTVWIGITKDTKTHDIYRKYMAQVLEWAASEQNPGGKFSVVAGNKREGVITKDYIAIYEYELERYLRKVNNHQEISVNSVLSEWADREWIVRDKDGKNPKIKVDQTRERMVKILLDAKDLPDVIEYEPIVEVEGEKGTLSRMPNE